jgi:peptidoglycan/xylan/chitin deacetylase (PgdA/CDA1 family)
MNRRLTIVAYHYVRDLKRSRFPAIKGLDLEAFRDQIDYLRRHYEIVPPQAVVNAVAEGSQLPPHALMLTFDDAYIDHFTFVFPILEQLGLTGAFFPSFKAMLERKVLDTHKIQFILAANSDHSGLLRRAFDATRELGASDGVKPESYYREHVKSSNFFNDPPETALLKKLLQRELPERVRSRIVDELFRANVSEDEAAFSCELYMGMDQMQCMRAHGMWFGCHGYDHKWLGELPPEDQKEEISRSLQSLEALDCVRGGWLMCYPHGSWNESLLELIRRNGCRVGLTVAKAVADLDRDDPLLLPRLDTNDLPKQPDATPAGLQIDNY